MYMMNGNTWYNLNEAYEVFKLKDFNMTYDEFAELISNTDLKTKYQMRDVNKTTKEQRYDLAHTHVCFDTMFELANYLKDERLEAHIYNALLDDFYDNTQRMMNKVDKLAEEMKKDLRK